MAGCASQDVSHLQATSYTLPPGVAPTVPGPEYDGPRVAPTNVLFQPTPTDLMEYQGAPSLTP
jgi:hypothetical protein